MPRGGSSQGDQGWVDIQCRLPGHLSTRTLFARAHASSKAESAELPAGRTLFLINVPPTATADAVQSAFEKRGRVSSVRLGTLDGGESSTTSTAHVVFAKASALKKVLSAQKPVAMAAVSERLPRAEAPEGVEELQRSVDSFMQAFEADELRRREHEEQQHNRMDDDGFVLVTRKRTGRSVATDGQVTVGAASAAAQAALAEKRKKKKTADRVDFYQFQRHERKKEQLSKLREQFEADKARIAKMRAERKFRPY